MAQNEKRIFIVEYYVLAVVDLIFFVRYRSYSAVRVMACDPVNVSI